ncbi:MAG: DUF2344 domain-containing protein, partial [Desulfatiglandales bacterium]
VLPPGLRIKWVARLQLKSVPLPQVPVKVKYSVYLQGETPVFSDEEAHRQHISRYVGRKSIVISETRKGKIKEREIRPLIESISLGQADGDGYRLEVVIDQGEGKSLNPWTLLKDLYNLNENEVRALRVVKTDAQIIEAGEYALRNRD